MFAAITFWFPKLFGREMNETLGRIHAVLTFVFFNLVFFPMHFLGVGGMMRRIYNPTQYEFLQHLQPIAVFMSVCAFILGRRADPVHLELRREPVQRAGRRTGTPGSPTRSSGRRPRRPPHGNWGAAIPTVYRGPYEYSVPGHDRGLPAADPGGGRRPRGRARALSAATRSAGTRMKGCRLAASPGVRHGGGDRRPDRGRRPRHQHRGGAGRARLADDLRLQPLPLSRGRGWSGACWSSTATGSSGAAIGMLTVVLGSDPRARRRAPVGAAAWASWPSSWCASRG